MRAVAAGLAYLRTGKAQRGRLRASELHQLVEAILDHEDVAGCVDRYSSRGIQIALDQECLGAVGAIAEGRKLGRIAIVVVGGEDVAGRVHRQAGRDLKGTRQEWQRRLDATGRNLHDLAADQRGVLRDEEVAGRIHSDFGRIRSGTHGGLGSIRAVAEVRKLQ